MLCPYCKTKSCRSVESCGNEAFDRNQVLSEYQSTPIQNTVQKAAELVDDGRAGTLNRLQEIMEFSKGNGYGHLGLAYCYGMESDARTVTDLLRKNHFRVSAVSCTTGAMAQKDINQNSELPGVSCNPLGQAAQLEADKPELVILMGLCLGHDILFQQKLDIPMTTLVVKDRTTGHNPLQAIRNMTGA